MGIIFKTEEDRLRYDLWSAAQALKDAAESLNGHPFPMLQKRLFVAASRAQQAANSVEIAKEPQ